MLVFREAKTMPVQQIVVNPVTLQQTNNKDRKVSLRCNAALEIKWSGEKAFCQRFSVGKICLDFLYAFGVCLSSACSIPDRTIEFPKNMLENGVFKTITKITFHKEHRTDEKEHRAVSYISEDSANFTFSAQVASLFHLKFNCMHVHGTI